MDTAELNVHALPLLQGALALVLATLAAIGYWAASCRCSQCHIHVEERKAAATRHRERAHDWYHKGLNSGPNSPDRFACPNDKCPRNPVD